MRLTGISNPNKADVAEAMASARGWEERRGKILALAIAETDECEYVAVSMEKDGNVTTAAIRRRGRDDQHVESAAGDLASRMSNPSGKAHWQTRDTG